MVPVSKMNNAISEIVEQHKLDIEAPFIITIENIAYEFQYLVRGYGSSKGMIVDSDWNRIKVIQSKLIELGYGFSCFNIEACEPESFGEVLEDWGKTAPNNGN